MQIRTIRRLFVAALFLAVPFATHAQQAQPGTVVAQVGIRNCSMTESGNTISINCDFINDGSVEPDIKYSVQLLQHGTNGATVFDQHIYPDVITLAAGQTLHKTIQYAIPNYASGQFDVWVNASNSEGLGIAFNPVGTITAVPSGTAAKIVGESCYIKINGPKGISTKSYTLLEGVDIKPSETLVGHCSVTNLGSSQVTLSSVLHTYRRNVFGNEATPPIVSSQVLSLAPGETKDYAVSLPHPSEPQAYDTTLQFTANGTPVSNAVAFHYVIDGATATIQNISLDKTSYQKSDTAVVTTFWTGSADTHAESRNAGTDDKAQTISVQITNDSQQVCGESTQSVPGNALAKRAPVVFNVPIQYTCMNPKVSVKIVDTSGNLLAQKNVTIPSNTTNHVSKFFTQHKNLLILIGCIVVALMVGLIGLVAYRKTRAKPLTKFPPGFSLFIVAMFGTFVLLGHAPAAHADDFSDTWDAGSVYNCEDDGYGPVCSYSEDVITTTFTVNLNKTQYAPGESIVVSSLFRDSSCTDGSAGGAILNITNNPTGQQQTDTWGSNDVMTQQTSTFTAPTTPGTYKVIFYGKSNIAKDPGATYTMYYTVAAPQPPSASLTANPNSVAYGGSSSLNWSSTNTTSCTGTGFNTNGATSGSVSTGALTSNASYSVSCTGPGGSTSASASVSVGSPPQPTASLTANPGSVAYGGASTLSWSSGNATSCTGSGFTTNGATSGSVSTGALNSNASYSVSCSGPGGSASASASVAVGVAPKPNLTSSIGPVVSTVAGQATTFTGTTYNIGSAATGNFYDLFIFYQSDGSTWQGSQLTALNGPLAAGANQGRSVSYTFPSSGSYYYRLCADWNNDVQESNENDNCSALQTVNVDKAKPAPPTGLAYSCNAAGTAVTFTWNPVPGADNYYVRIANSDGSNYRFADGVTATSYTFSTTPGQSYMWWIHSNVGAADYNPSHYSDPTYGPIFSCAGTADLTAGAVSPTTATAGSPVTLSATASNIGNGSSSAFPMLFQIQETSELFNSGYIAGLAPGGSGSGNASHTFQNPGTYTVRACANYNTSWTAITQESNYTNNCGPWTTVTVVPVVQPTPTCTLSSAASQVPTTLNWSSTNATSCTGGGFSTGNATSGSQAVSTAGAYTLSCTGAGGTCTTSTNVSSQACTNPAGTISAAQDRIQPGQSTTISYSATGITGSCTISGPGVNQTIAANSCNVSGPSVPTGPITTQSTYILTCDNVERARTIVNVVPKFVQF